MGRKPKVTAPANAPALDLSALTHEIVDLPAGTRLGARRKWEYNPFVELLAASRDDGKGRSVTVPGYHAREIVSGIRSAAEQITDTTDNPIGSRVVCDWEIDGESYRSSRTSDLPTDDTPILIMYVARKRRRSFQSDDERKEATAMGFVSKEGVPAAAPYFTWVEAGRPMESDETASE